MLFPACLVLCALCLFLFSTTSVSGYEVSFDGRSFIVNGERKLFVAGSFHYPRAPRSEWPAIFQQLKEQGINLIQTYVFWDIHEPENNQWHFPSDSNSNEDLVAFVQEASKHDLYVHLRIAGYVCAEWNFGGMPLWLKDLNATLRTYDQTWLTELSQFVEKTIQVVDSAKLLAKDGGPIIMLQMENEYGNMEKNYGLQGRHYVKWLSDYALSLNVGNLPWVMCQQGEGTGTAPSEKIVNACNGFYCDNWISKHTTDFPNQPHMWTENWPGWFQNWGDAIPHRPAVDVAFSVTRWFARGGTYMNYYMAYGGSTFGRHVGGPLIVTSYDYDVQVNEFSMKAEPKYTLLQQLHNVLLDHSDVLLAQLPPVAVPLAGSSNCESHTYESNSKCIAFFSNWDESHSCTFTLRNGQSATVLPWSVSIATGSDCSSVVYNTKSSVESIAANKKTYQVVEGFVVENIQTFAEPIPSSAGNSTLVKTVDSTSPLEQIATTGDHTDYLWYSFAAPKTYSEPTEVTMSFSSGSAGGGLFYIFANGQVVGSVLGAAGKPPISRLSTEVTGDDRYPVSVQVTLPAGSVSIDVLSVSMGLQNYGPYLEKVMAGLVSDVKVDDTAVHQYKQSIGLLGEAMNIPYKRVVEKKADSNDCKLMCWYSATFKTPSAVKTDSRLALELSASMGKGMVWVNGQMLGRYWNVTAKDHTCQECPSAAYVGSYNGDKCRSGCGSPSQQYYKLPVDWLKTSGEDTVNSIVLFDELGGNPQGVKLVEVSMV